MSYRPRIGRYVINPGTDAKHLCGWDDCSKRGVMLHRHVEPNGDGSTTTTVFCSNKHLQMYRYSHIRYGDLPPGERGGIL